MREFEPVECPRCGRHVDPEEYDEVDETCDHCRAERETARGQKEMLEWSDPEILSTSAEVLVDSYIGPGQVLIMTSTPDYDSWAFALLDMDPKDQPWGGSGMDDSEQQLGGGE